MKRIPRTLIPLTLVCLCSPAVKTLSAASITSFQVAPVVVSFPDQDPDLFPETQSQVNLRISFTLGAMWFFQNWQLEFLAPGDLQSGAYSIPISNARWQVTLIQAIPNGNFQNLTFSSGVYQTVGNGTGPWIWGNVTVQIDVTFYLQNSWVYTPGNYARQITARLTCPGDSEIRTFDLTTTIARRAKLELDYNAISFPDANPDTTPSIAALQNEVGIRAKSRNTPAASTQLSCRANADLTAGTQTIPITNVIWTATGSGYQNGVMSRIAAQPAGSWTGSGQRSGTMSYFLANSWNYNTGNYNATVVYTLSAL